MTTFSPLRAASAGLAFLGLGLLSGTAMADQVILDDLIVDGSACIGFDCVNGESFGFDTIRIKENNLRIRAVDTSASASFPTNDWQITFNDSSNGGANKFSIDDIDGGRTPFTIEAGAPSHSLYVDDGGRIGFGTNNPVVEVHTKDGDTPTLRLEQDGSSGFTPQSWDVAGNETNFFIRDVTNGSTLPFRIRPGAPTSAIDINAKGQLGIGTASPSALLSLVRGGAGADGLPRILFDNTDATSDWILDVSDTSVFRITVDGSGSQELQIDSSGNLTILGGLITTGGGGACTLADPCDLVFDPDVYKVPSIEDHAEEMWANKYLPAVGPTKAGEPINVTVKMMRMLNELEKAHIYIEQLNNRIAALETQATTSQ